MAVPPDPYAKPAAPPDPYAQTTPGGHMDFNAVRSAWLRNHGDPHAADTMAHIALSESGDGRTSNPSIVGPGYTENGHHYFTHGLFQLSDVHGYKDDLGNPDVNIRHAVELYNARKAAGGTGFEDWLDSKHKGGGGGWGQYLTPPPDPYAATPNVPLPKGGMKAVLGATDAPQHVGLPPPASSPARATFEDAVKDRMHAAIDMVRGAAPGLLSTGTASADSTKDRKSAAYWRSLGLTPPASMTGSEPQSTAPTLSPPQKQRLSTTLNRIGEAGDAFTFAPASALMRDLGGDHRQGISNWASLLFDPNVDAGKTLDHVATEYGFNSPADLTYWASQPGMHGRIMQAKPSTPQGAALQLSLGMHADLARLKLHTRFGPYAAGLETFAAETFNPAFLAAGSVGGTLGKVVGDLGDAARAGQYGAKTQRLAILASKAPMVGNRFTRMGDAFGDWGEWAHANLARDMNDAPHVAQADATSDDTFGHAHPDDQVAIVHAVEGNPLIVNPNKVVGGTSIADRAQNVAAVIRATENELRAVDPEMANKLIPEKYFPHGGAWDLPTSQASDPWGHPSVAGRQQSSQSPLPQGRIHPTLEAGQAAGLNMDPNWYPSAAMAMQQTKLWRYIKLANWVNGFAEKSTGGGNERGLFDIEYQWRMPNGNIRTVGTGKPGYERAMKFAEAYGKQRAGSEAATRGAAGGWTQEQIDHWTAEHWQHYRDVSVDDMRKLFRSKYPNHDFDASESLGMPMLKGKALHNAAVDAAIDSHPTLRKMQKGEGPDRFAIHTQDEMPENALVTWLDNLNSAVRQGILANVGFHPAFNLIPLALNAGVNPEHLARAIALDRNGTLIPKAWIDRSIKYNANAPKFGTALTMNPNTRAKMLTVPYDGLAPHEMLQKAFIQASKWNQDVTFGWFEDRISAVTMRHFEQQGMSPEAAARETRRWLGDYENMVQSERVPGLRNWQYFYTWMRGQLRLWGGQLLRKPQQIAAPVRGVQTANQIQGDEGSVSGGALSLRNLMGTDARGNPRYVSLPMPMFRYGTDVARMASFPATGDPTEALQTGEGILASHLPPLAGIGVGLLATAIKDPETPKPYDLVLFDKNAPSAGAKWLQFASKIGERYEPSFVRSPAEAVAHHDPALAIGALGPNVYSSSNSGPQSKLAYSVSQNLRAEYQHFKNTGTNPTLTNHLYDLLQRVNDGDPLAALQANRELKELRRGQRRGTHPRT